MDKLDFRGAMTRRMSGQTSPEPEKTSEERCSCAHGWVSIPMGEGERNKQVICRCPEGAVAQMEQVLEACRQGRSVQAPIFPCEIGVGRDQCDCPQERRRWCRGVERDLLKLRQQLKAEGLL